MLDDTAISIFVRLDSALFGIRTAMTEAAQEDDESIINLLTDAQKKIEAAMDKCRDVVPFLSYSSINK